MAVTPAHANYATAANYAQQAAMYLDRGDKEEEYQKALRKLVLALLGLEPQQRTALLGQVDQRVLAALIEQDEIKKDTKLVKALTEAVEAAGHLQQPSEAESKQIDRAHHEPENERTAVYERILGYFETLCMATPSEGRVNARGRFAEAEEILNSKKAKQAARAEKRAVQRIIEVHETVQGQAAFILGEPDGPEIIAHICGLPSRLSKAQREAAAEVELDDLLAKMGGPNSLAGTLADLTGHDPTAAPPAAARGATAGATAGSSSVDPDLQDTTPTVRQKLAALQQANPDAYRMIVDHLIGQQRSAASAQRCYNEIILLLNSGMTIESIIMLVMILLAERQEEKFNDKVKELTAYEQIDRMNATSLDVPQKIAKLEETLVPPADYGLEQKSSTIVVQELQAELQITMQVMQALAGVLRQIQDLVMTPARSIR